MHPTMSTMTLRRFQTLAVVIDSWQPETLRQHIRAGNVQHEAIPESLARRF